MSVSAEKMYDVARKVTLGKADLELGLGVSSAVLMLGIHYAVLSTLGLRTYDDCATMQGKNFDRLASFMRNTLIIALTIPSTLLLSTLVQKDVEMWAVVYGLFGLVTSATTVHLARKCSNANKKTKQLATGSLLCYMMMLIGGVFLLRKKPKVIV
jgi:hypothetical protein